MSIVFAQRLSDGLQVVIKSREKASSFSGDAEEREWRQTTLRQLGLPPIEATCRYLAVHETEEFYHVVMERASGLDLQRWAHLTRVSLDATKEIVHQILRSLRAMHSCGRIHRDLKLANVMVDFNSTRQRRRSSAGGVARASSTGIEARLIDFDTALDWDPLAPASTRVVGTDGYMAPEAYAGKFSPASDMYSVGVILYRLLTGQAPFRSKIFHDDDDGPGDNHAGSPSTRRLERRLKREKVDFACFPLGQCSEAQDLVRRLLAVAPEERPSAEEALQHAWFQAEGEQEAPTSPAATRKRFSLRGNTGSAWRPSGGKALVLPALPPVLLGAGGPPGSIGSHVQLHQQKLRAV